jgi:diaminopimelate epimerase
MGADAGQSGSSACAIASVAHARNMAERDVTILMPGGELTVSILQSQELVLTGEVREVAAGTIAPALTARLREMGQPLKISA